MDQLSNLFFTFTMGFRHRLEPGFFCPLHSHSGVEIVYHKTGEGTTGLESGKGIAFQKGDIVLYAPNMAHNQHLRNKGEDVCIQAMPSGAWPTALTACFKLGPLRNAYVLSELDALTSGGPPHSKVERTAYNHRVTALLMTLYSMVLSPKPRPRDNGLYLAERARSLIAERFAQLENFGEVADALDISEDYLRHSFKDQFGISMVQWLTTVRLERGKELLVHSPLRLFEVARDCGFSSQQYFTRVFKMATGMTPAQYRHENQARMGK